MRKMGIDYGTKKVGIALSDDQGLMAFPHVVLPNDTNLTKTLEELIKEKDVAEIVIGHSLNLSGEPNQAQAGVEALMTDLTLQTGLPIHLEPEQYTTQEAIRFQGRKADTDASAAAIILNSFITRKNSMSKEMISYDDFAKLDIALGEILTVDIVEDADKLLRLKVDVGEAEPRQIISGIRTFFADPQGLVGKKCPFLVNLEPRVIRGLESQGMILAAENDGVFALFNPHNDLPPGTRLN